MNNERPLEQQHNNEQMPIDSTSSAIAANPMIAAVSIAKLFFEINVFKSKNFGEYPKQILLSVYDGYKLEAEIITTTAFPMNTFLENTKVQFMGIRVIRSNDIEKGEILLTK